MSISYIKVTGSSYGLDKPLVVGEFASVCSEGDDIGNMFQYVYDNGYQVNIRKMQKSVELLIILLDFRALGLGIIWNKANAPTRKRPRISA